MKRIWHSEDGSVAPPRSFVGTGWDLPNTPYRRLAAAANPRIVEFDIVYVDGSHFGSDVVMDAVYAWDKLRVGGMMILDDYFWRYYANDFDNPGAAINAFLRIKTGSWQVVHVYNQVILRKIRASVPIEPDDA